jgi:hypothetical protein
MEVPVFLRQIKRLIIFSCIVLGLLCSSGCVSMLRVDGPYKGRVIDAETHKPIEGAVVLGVWNKVDATPAGGYGYYYDSEEVLTDKNGDFKIPGKGLLVLSKIDGLSLTIFKAGYEQFPENSSWAGLKEYGPLNKVNWDFGKGTFRLRRLTLDERRKRGVTLPSVPHKKQRLLIRETNKEMMEIGSPTNTILPEE